MTIIFDGPPDERPIMERLARQIAQLSGDSWKSAHTILQDALTKPEKSDGLREALKAVDSMFSEPGKHNQRTVANQVRKALDADSARLTAEANKPAFPNGRYASRSEGGV